MSQDEHDAAIAEFIRTKGITRCPTACIHPTNGSVSTSDQAALEGDDGCECGCTSTATEQITHGNTPIGTVLSKAA